MRRTDDKENEMGSNYAEMENHLISNAVVAYRGVDEIRFHPLHELFQGEATSADIEALAESVRQNGFIEPVTILPVSELAIDGFHRVEAAKRIGLSRIPIKRAKNELTDDQVLICMYHSAFHRKTLTKADRVRIWMQAYGGEDAFLARYKRDRGPVPQGTTPITNDTVAKRFGIKPNTVGKYINEVLFQDQETESNQVISENPVKSTRKPDEPVTVARRNPASAKPLVNASLDDATDAHKKQMLKSAFKIYADILAHSREQYGKLIEMQLNKLLDMARSGNATDVAGGRS